MPEKGVWWRDVVDYEGLYKVSEEGGIRSVGRVKQSGNQWGKMAYPVKGKALKTSRDSHGYRVVSLSKNNVRKTFKVHRLVAQAFIPNPENKPQVNHLDSDRANNKVSNLEWCYPRENSLHAKEQGSLMRGAVHNKVRLSLTECLFIKHWLNAGYSPKEIETCFDASRSVISNIKLNKHWSQEENNYAI